MGPNFRIVNRLKDGLFLCPLCSNTIIWTCSLSNKGYAYCSKSLTATQVIYKDKSKFGTKVKYHCEWKGEVKRHKNQISIFWKPLPKQVN